MWLLKAIILASLYHACVAEADPFSELYCKQFDSVVRQPYTYSGSNFCSTKLTCHRRILTRKHLVKFDFWFLPDICNIAATIHPDNTDIVLATGTLDTDNVKYTIDEKTNLATVTFFPKWNKERINNILAQCNYGMAEVVLSLFKSQKTIIPDKQLWAIKIKPSINDSRCADSSKTAVLKKIVRLVRLSKILNFNHDAYLDSNNVLSQLKEAIEFTMTSEMPKKLRGKITWEDIFQGLGYSSCIELTCRESDTISKKNILQAKLGRRVADYSEFVPAKEFNITQY